MLEETVQRINKLKGTDHKEKITRIKWYFNGKFVGLIYSDTLLMVLTAKNKILILDT